MRSMFVSTPFNQDISGWNVSSATTLGAMFQNATAFNQDISSWNVSNVTQMNSMFRSATAFDQDISGWNVSNVTLMQNMFDSATSFDQDISGWDVSSATTMASIFRSASSFNQDLSAWKLNPAGVDMSSALDSSGISQANYDAILIGWDTYVDGTDGGSKSANTPANVQLGASGLQYTLGGAAETARTSLTSTPNNWTISGDTGV